MRHTRSRISAYLLLASSVPICMVSASLSMARGTPMPTLLAVPIPLIAIMFFVRGSRVGDLTFVLAQCVVATLTVVFQLNDPPSATSGNGDVGYIIPLVLVAVFAMQRRLIVLQLCVALVCVGVSSRIRVGHTDVIYLLNHVFVFTCVAAVVRFLREMAQESLEAAEHGENTDHLTGLLNRRGFERRAGDEWRRRASAGLPLAFLLIDIDHFKTVNDTLGHARGDQLLRAVSRRLLELSRSGDIAYRLGGEEFGILAPCQPGEGALIAERIRRIVDEEFTVTVSIGVYEDIPTTAHDALDEIDRAISRADQRLYSAKRAGRNRVAADDVSVS